MNRHLRLLFVLWLTACSSSPYEPINQSGPIRALDRFFSGGATDLIVPPAGVRPQRQSEVWNRGQASQATSIARISKVP